MQILEKIKSFFNKIKSFKQDLTSRLSEETKYELVEIFLISMGLLVFTLRCLAIMELWNNDGAARGITLVVDKQFIDS